MPILERSGLTREEARRNVLQLSSAEAYQVDIILEMKYKKLEARKNW